MVGIQGCPGCITGGDHLVDPLSGDDAERTQLPSDIRFRVALPFCGRIARDHGPRLLLHRSITLQIRLLFQRLALQGLTINAEEQLTSGYVLSLGEGNAVDLSGNARLYFDAVHCLDIANCRDFKGNIRGDGLNRANRYRLCRARAHLGRDAGAGRHKETSCQTTQYPEQQLQYL